MSILVNGESLQHVKLFSLQVKSNSSLPGRYLMFSGEIAAGPYDHALLVLPYPHNNGEGLVNDSNSRLVRHEIVNLFGTDTKSMPWIEDPFQGNVFSLEIASNMDLLLKILKAKHVVDAAKLQQLWDLRNVLPKRCSFVIAKVNISAGTKIKAGFGVVYFQDQVFFPGCYHLGSTDTAQELHTDVQKFSGQSDNYSNDMPSHVYAKKILYLGSKRPQIQFYFKTGGSERLLLDPVYTISSYSSETPMTSVTDTGTVSESNIHKEGIEPPKHVYETTLQYGGPKLSMHTMISASPDYSQHKISVDKAIDDKCCKMLTDDPKAAATDLPFVVKQEYVSTTASPGRVDPSDKKSICDPYGILTEEQAAKLAPYTGVFANYVHQSAAKVHTPRFSSDEENANDEKSTRNSYGILTAPQVATLMSNPKSHHSNFVRASKRHMASPSCRLNPACDKTNLEKNQSSVDVPSLQLDGGTLLSCDVDLQERKHGILEKVLAQGKYYNPAGLHYNIPDFVVLCDFCHAPAKMAIGWAKYDVCLRCASNQI